MRIVLRADGGPGIGVGHGVRVLALAREAMARGHEVTLAGRLEGDLLRSQAEALGVGVDPVAGGVAGMPRPVELEDVDVLHVDSYEIGVVLPIAGVLRSVMHDSHHGVRPCEVAFDPTPGTQRERAPEGVAISARGGRWTPLRPLPERRERTGSEEALRVVVVMGGTDTTRSAPDALELLLRAAARAGVRLDALVVAVPATRERLDRIAAQQRSSERTRNASRVTVTDPRPDLLVDMAQAGLVLSAAGTTVWELCALGVPMALVRVVENQRVGYEEALAAGAALGLGGPAGLAEGADGSDAREEALAALLADSGARAAMGRRARALVDGLGTWRIVSAWESLAQCRPLEDAGDGLRARPAVPGDSAQLLAWRNDPVTRAHSRSTDPVAAAEHERWFGASLAREDRLLLVCEDASGPVGTVRWDLESDASGPQGARSQEWEVSITMAPERRGERLAVPMLRAGQRALAAWLAARGDAAREGLTAYLAVVHVDNIASRRVFQRAGYLPDLPADESGFERWVLMAR